jgi:hypothetical protein
MPASVLGVYSGSERTLPTMSLQQEIAEQVSQLPRSKQEQVLRFVSELGGHAPKGEKGSDLAAFAGTMDPVSAKQMQEAIDQDCRQIDLDQW